MILCICPNPSIDTFLQMDTFVPKEVNRIAKEQRFPGGKGVNVAMAIREMGHQTTVLGFWAGAQGKWLVDAIQELGIETYGPWVAGETRSCFTFKAEDEAWKDTEILGAGPELSGNDLNSFYAQLEEILPQYDMVVMSGSWPKGAPEDAYLPIIEMAENLKKKVIVDTSGKYLKPLLNKKHYGIHINRSEATEITSYSSVEKQQAVLQENFKMTAITRGKEGLRLQIGSQSVEANVHINKVISAVGSGDCLTAGVAMGIDQGLTIEEIAKLGVACGAANCLREELGMLYKKDVERLLNKVRITKNS